MAVKPKDGHFFRDHAIGVATAVVLAVVLAVGGGIYDGVKDNSYEIRRLNERHDALIREHQTMAQSVMAIKQSVLRLGLSKDPKAAEILGGLVVDRPTARGIELYRNGQVAQAVSVWQQAEKSGSRDAHLAMRAAGVKPSPLVPLGDADYAELILKASPGTNDDEVQPASGQ